MKPLLLLLTVISIACSNTANRSTEDVYAQINAKTDSIKTLLPIGGCFVYELPDGKFGGFVVSRITIEEDSTYYSFFINGRYFDKVPDMEDFKSGGIWGKKIAVMDSKPMLGFDRVSISEENLKNNLDKLTLVKSIPLSMLVGMMIGSSGHINSLEELETHVNFYEVMNSRIKKEPGIMEEYPYEIFAFDKIPLAGNPLEEAKPEIIWRLSKKTAHPKAAQLFSDEWFWNVADDLSPFGNDDGNNAFYIFKDWRGMNASAEPARFLDVLEERWEMSFAHKNVETESELPQVEKANRFYRNIDRAIIAVALGQIALEGKISPK